MCNAVRFIVNRSAFRLIFCGLAVACLLSNSEVALAARLHLVTVSDVNDPRIGEHCKSDVTALTMFFFANVRDGQLNTAAVATDMSEDKIMSTIRNLSVAKDDAILFVYTGHGGFRDSGKHLLTPTRKEAGSNALQRIEIPRDRVVSALKAKSCRLTVVMTDACYTRLPAMKKEKPHMAPAPAIIPPQKTAVLIDRLFFRSEGIVDINSCKQDQFAATYAKASVGSVFTQALAASFQEKRTDGSISWETFLAVVDAKTDAGFRSLDADARINELTGELQGTQAPSWFELNVSNYTPPEEATPTVATGGEMNQQAKTRFGAFAADYNGPGVRVTGTVPGSPATKIRDSSGNASFLEAGDVIVAVNGTRVDSYEQYRTLIKQSRQQMSFEIINSRDGRQYAFTAALDDFIAGGANQPAKTRFGAFAADYDGPGVRVTGTVPGSPATKLQDRSGNASYLEPGDVIISVNGNRVDSFEQYRSLINQSGRQMSFDIINSRDGRRYTYTATLNY